MTLVVFGLNNTSILDDFERSSLGHDVMDDRITYKHIPKSYSDQRSGNKEIESFVQRGSDFLGENGSVFINARKERDGPLNTRQSFINKGPSPQLRDHRDKRSRFCPDMVKNYLVKFGCLF
jgi:hypothetical protein